MPVINVLYGFSAEKVEQSISKELALRGYTCRGVKKTSRETIKDYLANHKEIGAVVLKEYLDGGGRYSAMELAELADVTKANIIVVLSTNHKGKNEMKEVYSAGILCAYFSDGKLGANPEAIADLICKGRTRPEARKYYKIEETVPDRINLTYAEFMECYKYLINKNEGLSIADRFITISRWLYPGQMGAFCDMLPDKAKEILLKYREFYDVANKVYRMGYSRQKYKLPKGLKRGIDPDTVKELADSGDDVRKNAEKESLPVTDVSEHMEEATAAANNERESIGKEEQQAQKPEKDDGQDKVRKAKKDEEELFPVEDDTEQEQVEAPQKEKKKRSLFGRKEKAPKKEKPKKAKKEKAKEEELAPWEEDFGEPVEIDEAEEQEVEQIVSQETGQKDTGMEGFFDAFDETNIAVDIPKETIDEKIESKEPSHEEVSEADYEEASQAEPEPEAVGYEQGVEPYADESADYGEDSDEAATNEEYDSGTEESSDKRSYASMTTEELMKLLE